MAGDSKYGKVYIENKPIPEGEPLFILRGQDKLASRAVKFYAALYWRATGDAVGRKQILKVAERMESWPIKKLPD